LELTQGEGGSPEDALRESIDRVQAIAMVHDLLSQDEDVRVVDAQAVMERLVPSLLRSGGVSTDRLTVRMDVQRVPLSSKRATVLEEGRNQPLHDGLGVHHPHVLILR